MAAIHIFQSVESLPFYYPLYCTFRDRNAEKLGDGRATGNMPQGGHGDDAIVQPKGQGIAAPG